MAAHRFRFICKEFYKRNCRACHGPTAKGLSSYPKLVGQSPEYLVDRLERYREREKIGPNTSLMAPRAKNLSDEFIINAV
ncbi:c-type cytochrome [uncultured Roseibium sp.]|uniref:c-type cytochrome n=1 Tax=uncultured Roseibium sp. TaxID=1936171 RepID=UPI00344D38FA